MHVDARDIQTKDSDERGRVYLGTEYAGKRLTVAIVEVEEDRPSDEELADAYKDAAAGAHDMAVEWDSTSEEAWGQLDQ